MWFERLCCGLVVCDFVGLLYIDLVFLKCVCWHCGRGCWFSGFVGGWWVWLGCLGVV